jgi:hypothetical protein
MAREQLGDTARMVVDRYGEMAAAGPARDFYGSTAEAIRAAAGELVSEKRLAAAEAENAIE